MTAAFINDRARIAAAEEALRLYYETAPEFANTFVSPVRSFTHAELVEMGLHVDPSLDYRFVVKSAIVLTEKEEK